MSDITIITVKNVDCRCIIHHINKPNAINLFKKKSVVENSGYI